MSSVFNLILTPAYLSSLKFWLMDCSSKRLCSCIYTKASFELQVCDALTHAARPLCEGCRRMPQLAAAVLAARAGRLERHSVTLTRICLHCGGGGGRQTHPPGGSIPCNSLDCAVFFERRKTAHELAAATALSEAGLTLLDKMQS